MSHLLSTVNAEAAAQADSGWQPGPVLVEAEPVVAPQPRCDLPLPSIGNWVVYHLREGDSRNRRTKFPALVMDGDQDAGTLMLWVVVDDGDTWMQECAPARVAPEPGWELVQPYSLPPPQFIAPDGLEVSNAELQRPGHVMHVEQHGAIETLEARVAALEAKRGPGRPPKPKE